MELYDKEIIIGQIGKLVFIKYGSFYITVHPCSLQLL